MNPAPHFADLQRRYREVDWVSEFQRLWAIFNHWMISQTGTPIDRDGLEQLKADPNLSLWVNKVITSSDYNFPHRVGDGYGGSYPRFAADNEISYFIRAVSSSPVIAPRINRSWRTGTEPRVRTTHTIALNRNQFLLAYQAHAQVLHDDLTFELTLHQTLPALGVHTTGCCFFRDPVPPGLPAGTNHHAQTLLDRFRLTPDLAELVQMIDSASPTDLKSDILETLYNVRNCAMHGSLDFLNIQDNMAARSGFDLLDSLVRDIRDNW